MPSSTGQLSAVKLQHWTGIGAKDQSFHILFVGAAAEPWLDAIRGRTAGKPTLLVGDTPGFAGRGVAIELFRKPDIFGKSERLRFRIDPAALKDRGLTVSAQLYDVAEVVR